MPSVSHDSINHYFVSRVKLKHFKLLVTVGEQGNILKASQLLNIAQPAVSKTIRDIEDAVNLPLFNRSSRGVSPTPYGDVLIKHAKLILSQTKHASEMLSSLHNGISGRITVGVLLAATPVLLPLALIKLKNERPKINVTIIEGTDDILIPNLKLGDIDIILGRMPEVQQDEELSEQVLYNEPIVVVARTGHPLAKEENLKLKDLLDKQWILPPPGTTLRNELNMAFHKLNMALPTNVIESLSLLTNRTLLRETDSIAVMPYQIFKSYEAINLLCQLPVKLKINDGPIGITMCANRELTPATQYLCELLMDFSAQVKQKNQNIY
jgi:DNA-binding transcriptional LysR family regulator